MRACLKVVKKEDLMDEKWVEKMDETSAASKVIARADLTVGMTVARSADWWADMMAVN